MSKLVSSAQLLPSASLPWGVPYSDVQLAPGVAHADAGAPCWWAWVGVALASAVLAGAMPPAMLHAALMHLQLDGVLFAGGRHELDERPGKNGHS